MIRLEYSAEDLSSTEELAGQEKAKGRVTVQGADIPHGGPHSRRSTMACMSCHSKALKMNRRRLDVTLAGYAQVGTE